MSTTTYQDADNLPEYDFDYEELHGERIILYTSDTNEPYVINPAGEKVYL